MRTFWGKFTMLVAAAMILAGCSDGGTNGDPSKITVNGRITVAGGQAVEGANVSLYGASTLEGEPELVTTSDAEGEYSLDLNTQGTYNLVVTTSTGLGAISSGIEVSGELNVDLEVAALGELRGTAWLAGRPDDSAGISVILPGTGFLSTTAPNGQYEVHGVPAASYSLRFEATDHLATSILGVVVTPGGTTEVPGVVVLEPIDNGGEPLEAEITEVMLSSASARAGETISVSFTIRNLGDTPTPEFSATIVLTEDALTGATGTVLGTAEIGAVPATTNSVIDATVTLPPATPDGVYFVWVVLQAPAPGSDPESASAPIMVGQSVAECLDSYAPGSAFCELAPGSTFAIVPSISGSRVIWEDRDSPSGFNRGVLLALDLASGEFWRVTPPGIDALQPTIEGDRLVYVEAPYYGCPDVWRYRVHDLATGVDEVFHTVSCDWAAPTFSLSGERVVWAEVRDDNVDVYLYDFSIGEELRLTDHPEDQANPHIFGDLVTWADHRHGGTWWDLYLLDLNSHTETRITADSTLGRAAMISETRIAWADLNPVWFTLHEYSLETGEQRATNAVPFSNWLTLSPSGRYAGLADQVYMEPLNATDIYLYDFETDATISLARYPYPWANVALSDEYIVWEGPDGDTTRLYIARIEDLDW